MILIAVDLNKLPHRGEPVQNPIMDQDDFGQDSSDESPVVTNLQKTPMVTNIPKLDIPAARGAPPQVPKLLTLVKPPEETQHHSPEDVMKSIYDSNQSQSGLMRIGDIHQKLIAGNFALI